MDFAVAFSPIDGKPRPPYRIPRDSTADFFGFHPLYPIQVSSSDAGSRRLAAGKPALRDRYDLRRDRRFGAQVPMNEALSQAGAVPPDSRSGSRRRAPWNPQVNAQLRRYRLRTQATG